MNNPWNDAISDMPEGDLLRVAVRGYTELANKRRPRPKSKRKTPRRPNRMLVLDTETITQDTHDKPHLMPGFDPETWPAYAQSLLFGTAHLYRWIKGIWRRVAEWTFYPDDLPPAALARLERRFNHDNLRMGDWREPRDSPGVKAYLLPLSEWLDVFYDEAVAKPCLIVGFNAPFDLSRLAYHVGPAKSNFFRGGFSFRLWADPSGIHPHNLYRPRLRIRKLTSHSTAIGFSKVKLGPEKNARRWRSKSEFLDLAQLMAALTGKPQSLNKACEALGVPGSKDDTPYHGIITLKYLRYNRQDTLLTADLAFAAIKLFDQHPVSRGHNPRGPLSESMVFSSASLAKAYLKLMGIKPRNVVQPDFPKKILGATMEGFYGGRTETWIKGCSVPSAYLDFVAMYPSNFCLQKLWPLVIAEKIEIEHDPEEAARFLEGLTLSSLLKPSTWSEELNRFVLIRPRGDLLPVRAAYGPSLSVWKIGVNPYGSDRPQWYPIALLATSKLISGRLPEILDSIRLMPEGQQSGLRQVHFGGSLPIDPRKEDFFREVVEERYRIRKNRPPYDELDPLQRAALSQALKTLVNSGAFGIYAEFNEQHLPSRKEKAFNLWDGHDVYPLKSNKPEVPGKYSFPPLASLITAGARLMLAILQHAVQACGGSYVLCDTDSMAIAYKASGGSIEIPGSDKPIKLLSDSELNEIIALFDPLNPYDRSVIPSILKHEYLDAGPVTAYSIAPKRYSISTSEPDPELVARKESALGTIMPPEGSRDDFIDTWWEAIGAGKDFPFSDFPLIRQTTIQTWEIHKRFKKLNRGKLYREQVKPFNFLMTATPDSLLHHGARTLIAPYSPNSETWARLPWIDSHSGKTVRITTDMSAAAIASNDLVAVQTLGAYFQRFRNLPVWEFQSSTGERGADARGLLAHRPVRRSSTALIGKETTSIPKLSEAGLVEPEPPHLILPASWFDPFRSVLADIPRKELRERLRVDPSTIRRWLRGTCQPSEDLRYAIERICYEYVVRTLQPMGIQVPDHPRSAVAMYTDLAPRLRIWIQGILKDLADGEGVRPLACQLNLHPSTLRRWMARPESIELQRAILAFEKTYPDAIAPLRISTLLVRS